MTKRHVEIRILSPLLQGPDALPLPGYATPGAAAMDLRACLPKPVDLDPGERLAVPTGLALNMIDRHLVAIIASRSGLSLRHGIRVAQGIGVIDADYQGEIQVLLANDGKKPYTIQPGERIAQLLFQSVLQVDLKPVDAFSTTTDRGQGGFGSTGRH